MKANNLLSSILEAIFSFEGSEANAIQRTEVVAMTIKTFPLLEVDTFFNQTVDLGNVATVQAYRKAKLTQYTN
jgi:hypothetical protein